MLYLVVYMTDSKRNIKIDAAQKPDLPKELFWDWRYHEIDWQKTYLSIIERVLERGTKDEWKELIRFYGEPKIKTALTKEIMYLPDYIIEEVTRYFSLRQEDLACYVRQKLRRGQWI